MVHDLLDNQNILKDIFEDKRGQCQKWWRREKVETRLEFFESLNGTTDFACLVLPKNLLCPLNIRKILKLNFLCQIKFKSNFILSKKSQIKSNQISWIMICASNFFQIICFNKNKTNQIKSNLWDIFFISNFFQIFGYNKNKSNQIKSNFLDHDLYFKFFLKFLGLRFNIPNQIKSNFVAIIWPVKLKQINLIWFDLNHF